MIVTQEIKLDLTGAQPGGILHAVQGDADSRLAKLSLWEGTKPWQVPEGISAALRYCRPDGAKGIYDTLDDGTAAWSVEDNAVSVILAPQMLAAPGVVFAQLELIRELQVLASFPFRIRVAADPSAGAVTRADYVNWLGWFRQELEVTLGKAAQSGEFSGEKGDPGATFIPTVSAAGDLSWRNDQGLENPEPVNLMGLPGKSAYAYAVEGGYSGTESQFASLLAGGGMAVQALALTLTAADWSQAHQVLEVAAVTADNHLIVSPAPESHDRYSECGVRCVFQSDGLLTFACSTVPDGALTVNVLILG